MKNIPEKKIVNQNQLPLYKRLWIYQKERFPIFGHGPLILMFTFSAISYSRICRGVEGFIASKDLWVGFLTTFCLFLLVRILDEFKDADTDRQYRKELPVPRGLISFKELRILGVIVLIVQVLAILLVHPSMFVIYLVVMAYLALMTVEFFAHDWLNKHMWLYAASHMMIIPLVDIYASGLDWYLDGDQPHLGLFYFFGVSYFNGIVLEIGRKLKAPSQEKEGVVTYSAMMGYRRGVVLWMIILGVTALIAAAACYYAGISIYSYYVLALMLLVGLILGQQYLRHPTTVRSKRLELISGVWTLVMYGTLGGVPGIIKIIS
ncbi:UbiA family prenyltransferase [Portibacter marinus]|uniref:UbiA family prenyltransferase n=1 Tax=Portibacter marinus TaxID=2898660 RepID=UPI001F2E8C61|nr:UbiA family prenyltransferase [Portibacter marinus]